MRARITLDVELVAKAADLIELTEKSALVREAFKALLERESARRLARLGGSDSETANARKVESTPL